MDISYSNIVCSAGRLILKQQISIWGIIRWVFDTQILNCNLGYYKIYVLYLIIEYPCEIFRWMFDNEGKSNIHLGADGRLILNTEYSIWEVVRCKFDIQILDIHLGFHQMNV